MGTLHHLPARPDPGLRPAAALRVEIVDVLACLLETGHSVEESCDFLLGFYCLDERQA